MNLKQRVRVHVAREGSGKETVLETARGSIRSRVLSRLLGNRYGVFVVTPVGARVDAVEVRESRADGGEESG